MVLQFPDSFFWGTSTAAAQVETASEHNWKGVRARDGYLFDRTTDHELHRMEDAGYIKQFGTVYRCGVDWARLQPAPFCPFDKEVLEEYQAFFAYLNGQGMQIMFVLHHFTHPRWFEDQGGWLEEGNIAAYIDFVYKCRDHFGPYVQWWNTFNEPNVYAMNGYLRGVFPPWKKSYTKANRVLTNMGQAHDIACALLREGTSPKPVGISLNTAWFHGQNLLGKIPARFTDWWFHRKASRYFRNVDFWGISYYAYVPFGPGPVTELDKPGKLDKMGIPRDNMWGYRPEGLGKMLRRIHRWYGKPIIITENGICTDDPQRRIQSIKDYLRVIHQAIAEGIPVKGYIHWSTWDNFEWHLGPTFRFGLVRVNIHTKQRSMTEAGVFFSQVARDNQVSI